MKKIYFVGGMLMAAALAAPMANAQGAWRNVNHLLTNVSGVDGWSGIATGSNADFKLAEFFNGAGKFYYVVEDAPAGTYTLTAKAFNRNGSFNNAIKEWEAGNKTTKAYIFLNDEKGAVKNIFDEVSDFNEFKTAWNNGENQNWEVIDATCTNGLNTARTRFDEGKYGATVTCNHPGGDLYLGIINEGQRGWEEWTAFGDFKLVGPNGEVTLPEIKGYNKDGDDWNKPNADYGVKTRGLQNGAVWSKTNGSPYNISTTITIEEGGKYRLIAQTFNEYFIGSHNGYCVPFKDAFAERTDIPSAKDLYDQGATQIGSGAVRGTSEWNPTTFFKMDALHAYMFIYFGDIRSGGFDEEDTEKLHNFWKEGYFVDNKKENDWVDAPLADNEWAETQIMNIFDEKGLTDYPECQNWKDANGNWVYKWDNGDTAWWESGMNFEVGKFFIANPDKYINSVELEIPAGQKVTLGYRKDINQNNYWNPVFDLRLEKWDPTYNGYVPAGVEELYTEDNANAPKEYFNLQGMRVAEPTTGIYIVKQGTKVSKELIRK